jgi:heme/copper-type cytochrome/quinol oxidase subunit 2
MTIRNLRIPALAVSLVFVWTAAAAGQEPRKITVTAKKYEFNPSRIELKVGEPVEITFESEDTTHGFALKELGIEKVTFKKGEPATVKLTAEKAGTYPFKCAKFCGMGHGGMKGEIVVSP